MPRRSKTEIPEGQEKAESLLRFWQQVLRVQDWTVRIEVVSAGALEEKNALAETKKWVQKMSAHIYLLREDQIDRFTPYCDWDYTIVHELLHLIIDMPSCCGNNENLVEEQTIDRLAQVIVDLRRNHA